MKKICDGCSRKIRPNEMMTLRLSENIIIMCESCNCPNDKSEGAKWFCTEAKNVKEIDLKNKKIIFYKQHAKNN